MTIRLTALQSKLLHDIAVSHAEDELAPKYYAVGGGTIEETMALEKVRRFQAILKSLQSPGGSTDADLLPVIEYVNKMKVHYPDEFARLAAWDEGRASAG